MKIYFVVMPSDSVCFTDIEKMKLWLVQPTPLGSDEYITCECEVDNETYKTIKEWEETRA